MFAREFFTTQQRDGRAALKTRRVTRDEGNWGDDGTLPTRWLISLHRRLVLCSDDAVLRIVAEDEVVERSGTGFKLAHHVLDDSVETVVQLARPVSRFYFGKRTFDQLGSSCIMEGR